MQIRFWVGMRAFASVIAALFIFMPLSAANNTENSTGEINNNLDDVQCIHFGDQARRFGSVTDNDWRDWMVDFRFATGEEHLSVETDDDTSMLRQIYVPSARGSDRVVAASHIEPHRTYRITQTMYLEPGWEWGGDTFEGGKLGFGFGGGTNPSGASVDPAGFTARIIWRGNYLGGGKYDGTGRLAIYSYAADRSENYGEDYLLGEYSVPIGEWFNIVFEIKANSSIESSDGSARAWVNGELLLDKSGIAWQQAEGTPLIDTLYYSSFYGGSNQGWAPSKQTYAKFKDICWAPVIDGDSGIDPDNEQQLVQPTQNSQRFVDEVSDVKVADWIGLTQNLLQKTEEAIVYINVITPDAVSPAPQHYTFTLTALNQTMDAVRVVSEKSLSVNPVAWAMVALEELEVASQLNSVTDIELEELIRIRQLLEQTIELYPMLALMVVNQAQTASGCDDINLGNLDCEASTSFSTEAQTLFDGMINNPSEDIHFIGWSAEQAWNLSVEAINILEEAEL